MALTFAQARELAENSHGMNADETIELLRLLMTAQLSAEDGGALLRAWAARGETGTELAAAVTLLREQAVRLPLPHASFDLCGTGGSGLTRFNVSTTVAFIAAAAGVLVAKHGNRGSSKPNGSFDLLEALGIPFDFAPAQLEQLQKETGLCFVFARSHHPAVGKVVPYRKAAGGRTIFNLAGPLANPAPLAHQLIGTIDEKTAHVVADALSQLSTRGALVVWGEPGIDEISVTGKTGFLRVIPEGIVDGELNSPEHANLDYSALPGGNAEENAETFLRVLKGEEQGPLLDMIVENAGAAIDLWNNRAPQLKGPGALKARELINNRSVLNCFEKHKNLARSL